MCVNHKMTDFEQKPGNHIFKISSNKVKVKSWFGWQIYQGAGWISRESGGKMGNEPRTNPLTVGADPDEGVDQGILIQAGVGALAEAARSLLLLNSLAWSACSITRAGVQFWPVQHLSRSFWRQLQRVGTAGVRTKSLRKLTVQFSLQLRLKSDLLLHLNVNKCKTLRATLNWIAFNIKQVI